MRSIMVSSPDLYSGKSAITMALALKLKDYDYKVGYMKPVGNIIVDANGVLTDDDALNMKRILELQEGLDDLAPILFTYRLLDDVLEGKEKPLSEKLMATFERVSKGKDTVILEGAGDLSGGSVLSLSDFDVARMTGSRILLVARYCDDFAINRIVTYMKLLPKDVELAGIVFNNIGPNFIGFVKEKVVPYFEKRNVRVLGVIPQNKALMSVTAGEIAQELHGKVLAGKENIGVSVSGIVVGAMSLENAIKVFRRKPERAVITAGDRADTQMAALEARSSCVLLSGNLYPEAPVLGRAEELGIPIILFPDDTMTLVDKMEALLRSIRIKNPRKIELMKSIFSEHVDVEGIIEALK
jgi:BioD-like phosphotransacetylase family protein